MESMKIKIVMRLVKKDMATVDSDEQIMKKRNLCGGSIYTSEACDCSS